MHLAWAVAHTAAAVLGRLTRPDESPLALVWPAGGVATLWVLYAAGNRRIVAVVLLGGLGTVVTMLTGANLEVSLALGTAGVLHAVTAATVLERQTRVRGASRLRLAGTRDLARLGAAAVAGGLVSMPLGLLVWSPTTDSPLALTAAAWVLRHGVATAVVVSVALAWQGRRTTTLWRGRPYRTAELVLAVAATAAVFVAVFATPPGESYAFLVLPFVVWIAVRMGPFVTSLVGVFAGAVAVLATLSGNGPFGEIGAPLRQSLLVQSFVAVVGLVALALSLAVEDRRRALRRAGDALEALQQTLDGALVGQAVIGLDSSRGRIVYANATLRSWYRDEELVGRPWLDLVGSEDRETAEGVLDELIAGRRRSWYGELQHRTPGLVRWCEVAAAELPPAAGITGAAGRHASVQLLDVTARREFADRLSHQALHDELTGLPNRVLLRERLDHALVASRRSGSPTGLVFIDLDHFKTVNDSLGHAAGDEVLRTVATRLVAAVRPGDTVGRVGGDEFVVCCPDVGDSAGAAEIAERLLQAIGSPMVLDGRSITVSASAGIALANPADDVDDLLRESDTAMYAAKARGRGRIEFFEDALYRQAQRRLDITNDARRGLARGEFVLHYQPVMSLEVADDDWEAAEVVAVEALVRWQHPELGLLPPGEWLDVVESSDVMNELGAWVLHRAAADVAQLDGLRLHVNVSAIQLRQAGMLDTVVSALDCSTLDADRLVLELTETQLVAVRPELVDDLNHLCELGVSLSVDDFGTHYSSLTQLTTLPVTELKVDRSFVLAMQVDQRARAIVQGVLGMAGAMGLPVVGEGVEIPEVASELRRWGCPKAQGYLWARPQPWDDLRTRLPASGRGPLLAHR